MDFSEYKGIYVMGALVGGKLQRVTGELTGEARQLADLHGVLDDQRQGVPCAPERLLQVGQAPAAVANQVHVVRFARVAVSWQVGRSHGCCPLRRVNDQRADGLGA